MLSAILVAALAVTPAEGEAKLLINVRETFERVGRSAPKPDTPLEDAAKRLAREAANTSAARAGEMLRMTEAISMAGGHDASPRAIIVRASSLAEVLEALQDRRDLTDQPASHLGIGVVETQDASAAVILLAERRLELEPFSRRVPRAGAKASLCGTLRQGHRQPEIFVTRPGGQVDKVPARERRASAKHTDEVSFCGDIVFKETGRFTLEVLARSERGPDVAGLFFVDVGDAAQLAASVDVPEPKTVDAAREAILERINALRRSQGLGFVREDTALNLIAQAYSDRMSAENFFAHVAPDGSDLRARLHRAGYRFAGAGENLGLASGPLAAHFGIEHSPGHRKNLLEPKHERIGIGVTFEQVNGRTQARVVQVLASTSPALEGEPLVVAYRAVERRRAELQLPKLTRDKTLERLAADHAEKALAAQEPKSELRGERLHDRVFRAMPDVGATSVDFFIADSPALVTDSENLADARNRRVGIGTARGDSSRFGQGKYWVVVIYAAPR